EGICRKVTMMISPAVVPASDDSLNSQLTTFNFSACHRRRVNEREQHQDEIERVHCQRTIMLRPALVGQAQPANWQQRSLTNLKWSDPGASTDESELREFARANIAHFIAPHSVTFLKELPKTTTGKIQKYILRGRATSIAPQ